MKYWVSEMKDYLGLVPSTIRDAVMALYDDTRWNVFICILENEEISLDRLRKELDLPIWLVSTIAGTLGECGLIAQYTTNLKDIDNNTYYKVTSIGLDFIKALMDKFLPNVVEDHSDEEFDNLDEDSNHTTKTKHKWILPKKCRYNPLCRHEPQRKQGSAEAPDV